MRPPARVDALLDAAAANDDNAAAAEADVAEVVESVAAAEAAEEAAAAETIEEIVETGRRRRGRDGRAGRRGEADRPGLTHRRTETTARRSRRAVAIPSSQRDIRWVVSGDSIGRVATKATGSPGKGVVLASAEAPPPVTLREGNRRSTRWIASTSSRTARARS